MSTEGHFPSLLPSLLPNLLRPLRSLTFDPNRVHGAVRHDPGVVGVFTAVGFLPNGRKYPRRPFLAQWIHFPVHFRRPNRFRVDALFPVLHVSFRTQSVPQHPKDLSFSTPAWTDQPGDQKEQRDIEREHRERTPRKHRERTSRENTEKTSRENTEREHRERTPRKHQERTSRENNRDQYMRRCSLPWRTLLT